MLWYIVISPLTNKTSTDYPLHLIYHLMEMHLICMSFFGFTLNWKPGYFSAKCSSLNRLSPL